MKKLFLLLCVATLPCTMFAQFIPNAGMESWRTTSSGAHGPVSVEAPNGWFTSDSIIIALGQNPIIALALGTSDADWRRQIFKEPTTTHGGSFSAKVMTMLEDTFEVAGIITNATPSVQISFSPPGITGLSLNGGSPISVKPVSVSAWVQYYPGKDGTGMTGIDSGLLTVQALGHVGGKDSVIGTGTAVIAPSSSWVQVTANIVYIDAVHAIDTFRIAFSSSKTAMGLDSSTLYVDDVTMTTTANPDNSGVHTVSGNELVHVYPNPANGIVYISAPQNAGLSCKLFNTDGRVVAETALAGTDKLDVSKLPAGVYFYDIVDNNGSVVQKGKLSVQN